MSCQACERQGGAIDYKCVACCVRLLLTIPFKESRQGLISSMERIGGALHGEAIRSALLIAWKKKTTNRKPKGKPV